MTKVESEFWEDLDLFEIKKFKSRPLKELTVEYPDDVYDIHTKPKDRYRCRCLRCKRQWWIELGHDPGFEENPTRQEAEASCIKHLKTCPAANQCPLLGRIEALEKAVKKGKRVVTVKSSGTRRWPKKTSRRRRRRR